MEQISNSSGSFEYKKRNGSGYMYNENGSLVADKSRGIAYITYDYSNNPKRIYFTNGSVTKYVYSASGQKLRVVHYTAKPNISRAWGKQPAELIREQIMQSDSTDYLLGGSLTVRNGRLDKYLFEGGYAQASAASSTTDNFAFYFYNQDHLGNVREVVDDKGKVQQATNYYPFGVPYTDVSVETSPDFQPYKYNDKELDKMYGLNTYDYGARQYNPVTGRWDRIDPLAEKYYDVSPYNYCLDNPVKHIDPDGKEVLPVLFEKLDQRGNAYGTPYRSSSKFVKAMTKFANTTYGNQFVSSFLPRGRKQYGVKGNGQYANYVFRIEEFNFSDPNEQFVTMGNVRGSFKVQEVNGKLNVIMSLDVAGQSENELIETITHELALHGYNIDKIIMAYENGGMEAVNALRQEMSESAEHKDIQKKKKGGKQYHKTRKELVEQYTILNDVFNEKMSEYEKLYGF